MQARITRFKMRPDAVEAARALVHQLQDEIMAQPGIERCIVVMNEDGSGHVVALIDRAGSSPEAVDRVRTSGTDSTTTWRRCPIRRSSRSSPTGRPETR
jgi:hypothetical protein